MNKEGAMKEMQECVDSHKDQEMTHILADHILCEFLEDLGHRDLVELFEEVGKWYA